MVFLLNIKTLWFHFKHKRYPRGESDIHMKCDKTDPLTAISGGHNAFKRSS